MARASADNDPWDAHWDDTPQPQRDADVKYAADAGAEMFDLTETGDVWRAQPRRRARVRHRDGESIDWIREEAVERERQSSVRSMSVLKGTVLPSLKMWIVLIATGIGVGVTGAWLDVLVQWLGDLREGRCAYGIFYNQVACCTGLDRQAGEICVEWQTWSQWLGVRSILAQSLIQALSYIALGVAFAGAAAILVQTYAPYAFHTGIPEIKAILGGYVFDAFLGPWTLLIKALGLALAVASGLSLGKEGPLVHVACCMSFLLSRMFKQFKGSEAQKRKLLAAAAAAGVSVAFGSPLGGVLFGLEELETFGNETDVMWRAFVTSVIAAVSLQYIDPFGTAKLVLFQVTAGKDTWRAFELVPWVTLGVIGGVLGSVLIKLNAAAATWRRQSIWHEWPVLEVIGVSAVTAAISYLVVFLRVQSSELVAQLFLECDASRPDYHGLCNQTALWRNVFLLLLTAAVKLFLTAWTFGMMVPAGIFLPTIAIGACLGRAMGLFTQGLHRAYPAAWVFASCPPDPTVRCVSPGFYAVIGASAMLGGVTRMTIALVVILFELTGALSHVLPIMIACTVSKWVGDAFGKEGIYSSWIAMRRLPWLSPDEYRDRGEGAAHIMKGVGALVVAESEKCTVAELTAMARDFDYHGFPVVQGGQSLGYISRGQLQNALESLEGDASRKCTFGPGRNDNPEVVDLSWLLEDELLELRPEVPQEFLVHMFQKLNLHHVLLTEKGKLVGLVTKADVVRLMTAHYEHTAALEPLTEHVQGQ